MWIFVALLAVPIIEIGLFIEIGGAIGLWPTLALVILTAIAGTVLLRAQGFATMARLQSNLAEGGDPRGALAHGAMILFAGALLLTPGFFTDAVGFLLLLPPFREMLIRRVGPALAKRMVVHGGAAGASFHAHGGPQRRGGDAEEIIEASYEDLTDGPPRPGGSGWSKRPD